MNATRRTSNGLITLVFAILATGLAAPTVQAQTSMLERMARMYGESDEYFFFESDRKKVVDYKTDRTVRICTGTSRHLVPLKITYDGDSAKLASGDCMRIEAKEIYLEPEKELDQNWVIQATVETMN